MLSTKQLQQEVTAAQMHRSPTGVAQIMPGSVKALRMAAKRNQENSRVSDPLAKAPHTTIEVVTQHQWHGDPFGSNVSSTATQKPRSLVETLVEDRSLVAMPPGHDKREHSSGSDKVRKKKKHGSRSRSRGHSPAPRSLSRGRSPARTHKTKKHKTKKHKKKNKTKKHRQRDRSRDSSSHTESSRSTISKVDSTCGSDPYSKAEPEFTGPPFMNPNKQCVDEDKSVIDDDEEEDDQTCSAACSKDNVNLLVRQLVAEAIGVYFLVTTVGLTAAQGLMLGPVAVGNDNN